MTTSTDDWLEEVLGEFGAGFKRDFPTDELFGKAKSAINQRIQEVYRRGYNDNSRDCGCGEFPIEPHHHIMTDGESHIILLDEEEHQNNKEVKKLPWRKGEIPTITDDLDIEE